MSDGERDILFMRLALEQAEAALKAGEFPVGCVITDGAAVVASGFRKTSRGITPSELDHAEILALKDLYENGPEAMNHRLCLYTTLEPCLMCFGAALISGIHRIVYAFEDVMGGGTSCRRESLPPLYRDVDLAVIPHVCRDESVQLMRAFFSNPENSYLRGTLFASYAMGEHLG